MFLIRSEDGLSTSHMVITLFSLGGVKEKEKKGGKAVEGDDIQLQSTSFDSLPIDDRTKGMIPLLPLTLILTRTYPHPNLT